ncbi:MAG: lytic transglycosylase domain-containing protein, partial [Mesorhizobium sp.]
MPTRQSHFFALVGAILLLTPSLVAAGKVDVQVTSTIPMPNRLQGPESPPASVARLKSGLDALAANDIAGARRVRDALPVNSLDQHILAWSI